jgi:hypothetical protein
MVWDILNFKNHLEGEISWLPNEFTFGPNSKGHTSLYSKMGVCLLVWSDVITL